MPPARPMARPRATALNNENDENTNTRVTRAKAAALSIPADSGLAAKKPLQGKKGTLTADAAAQPRKRAALSDVTNAGKGDATGAQNPLKKTQLGAVAKALAPTTQKRARGEGNTFSTTNTKETLKRPVSVIDAPTANAPASKRRASGDRFVRSESPADENVKSQPTITSKTVTETISYSDGTKKVKQIKQEIPRDLEAEAAHAEIMEEIARMDEEDADDPLMVAEYAYEIFGYMKELEQRMETKLNTHPDPEERKKGTAWVYQEYMDRQPELDWKMRGVLVDWLLEVHTRFHLLPETLYVAVNLIDHFLSFKTVQLDRLQLVGVTAMFIASKYEEVLSPHIGNFVHIAEDGFKESDVLLAEKYMLSTLDFDLSSPNPMHFLRRISKADNYDIETRTMAKYLLEISLLDHRFLEFVPSETAAAAMHLSRQILNRGPWDEILEHYSTYQLEEFSHIVDLMLDYLSSPIVHAAFYKKYAGKRFMKASITARQYAKKWRETRLAEQERAQAKGATRQKTDA